MISIEQKKNVITVMQLPSNRRVILIQKVLGMFNN